MVTLQYKVLLDYVGDDGMRRDHHMEWENEVFAQRTYDQITEQIKQQDREIIDREFEEALLRAGKDET